MHTNPAIAAWLDSYRLSLREALETSTRDGFRAIQANTVGTELNPDEFSSSARRHFIRHLAGLGLQLTGLAADFEGAGVADPHFAEQRLDHLRRTLELCADLKAPHAIVTLGGFDDARTQATAAEVLAETAELADRYDIQLAIRDPLGEPAALSEQLRRLACPRLSAVVDSAAFHRESAPDRELLQHAGTVLLRDVRRSGTRFEEVSYGRGDVDFPGLLGELAQREYSGPLVLRRDASGLSVDALRQGREYLDALLAGRAVRQGA